jgi:hypothetical protein
VLNLLCIFTLQEIKRSERVYNQVLNFLRLILIYIQTYLRYMKMKK